jgi:hypothetical protein
MVGAWEFSLAFSLMVIINKPLEVAMWNLLHMTNLTYREPVLKYYIHSNQTKK